MWAERSWPELAPGFNGRGSTAQRARYCSSHRRVPPPAPAPLGEGAPPPRAAGTGAAGEPRNHRNFRNPKVKGFQKLANSESAKDLPQAPVGSTTPTRIGVLRSHKPPQPGAAPRGLHGASARPTDLSRGNRASSPLWKSVLFSSLARMSILFISTSSMSLIRRSTPRDSSAPITAGTQRDTVTGCLCRTPSPSFSPKAPRPR